jgi:spermidine synthase
LNIYSTNVKDFIKQPISKYDLILIGLPAPINLYLNSCYIKEFFEAAGKILNNDGFLALTLPGKKVFSPYLTSELNASLKSHFNSHILKLCLILGYLVILILYLY